MDSCVLVRRGVECGKTVEKRESQMFKTGRTFNK